MTMTCNSAVAVLNILNAVLFVLFCCNNLEDLLSSCFTRGTKVRPVPFSKDLMKGTL